MQFHLLCAGVEIGLGIAVGLAMAIVIFESAFPKVPKLGRINKSTVYRWASNTQRVSYRP